MRIAVLWTHLSGYMNACLRALTEYSDVELYVANIRASADAPFEQGLFSWMDRRYEWEGKADKARLLDELEQWRPNAILCANWHNPAYRDVLRRFKGRSVRIFTSDRPWLGNPRQWLGALTARVYLQPLCDAFFVAGERQAVFANKMGYSSAKLLRGLYSCDHASFASIYSERMKSDFDPRSFLFVGRLVPEKGIDTLVKAFRQYRKMHPQPWPLKIIGNGPLSKLVQREEGIEYRAFCQPDELPAVMRNSSCLILPSIFEPWGLVVHEAAAAGMAVITSDAVGASVHLVQDGYNGYVVESANPAELAMAMVRYSTLGLEERTAMAGNGYKMSRQFTPRRWANTLISRAKELSMHHVDVK